MLSGGETILREGKVAQKGREGANFGEPEIEFRVQRRSEFRVKN